MSVSCIRRKRPTPWWVDFGFVGNSTSCATARLNYAQNDYPQKGRWCTLLSFHSLHNHRGIELFFRFKMCTLHIYCRTWKNLNKIWKEFYDFFIFNFNLSVFLYCFFKEVIRLFSDIFLSHYWPYQNVLLLPTKYYTIIFILKKTM